MEIVPTCLPDFNQAWISLRDFHKSLQYQISRNFWWESRWYVRTEKQKDKHTEGMNVTKETGAKRDFAKALKSAASLFC